MNAESIDVREAALPVFVRAITHYFSHLSQEAAETEAPYLLEGPPEISDFTAVVGVSGDVQGCVYYTAPRAMLDRLLHFVGEPRPTDQLRSDMAGEVANTLSGNARRQLGPGFMISVPTVLQGKPTRLTGPKGTACFVIPILWQEMRSLLMLYLADNAPDTADIL
jgi:chemotaxis protein CheX